MNMCDYLMKIDWYNVIQNYRRRFDGAIGMYVFKLIYSGSEIVVEKTANLLIYYVTN